jgi:enoyl-CoA hydratase/carnithine racemase
MQVGIGVSLQGGVARVTLCHATRLNAMTRQMWRDLRRVFSELGGQPELRCVLVSGEGAHFCAGGDISEYPAFRFEPSSLRQFHEGEVWPALQAMLDCDVPLVAQIAGNCMGAGLEIASCCDLRLAAASARFGAPIARLGFPMAPREAALVVREAGLLTAREMLLEAAVLDAPQMLARGFLSRVLPDDGLASEAQATVQRLVALAPQAARLNKQTLRTLVSNTALAPVLIEDIAINIEAISATDPYAYALSVEHREGVHAFLDKRKPAF